MKVSNHLQNRHEEPFFRFFGSGRSRGAEKRPLLGVRFRELAFLSALWSICMLSTAGLMAQTTTVPTGSFIINMGVTPQSVNNGLRPYGMVYDLLKNYNVPIIWSINPSKIKDGIDFSHNGVDYRGGTFIIPAEFRTSTVNSRIAFWQGQGVVGATTVSSITVPVYEILRSAPKWTLDKQNGSIAAGYFTRASIPASAHNGASSSGWKEPGQLDCCDDIFAMPHADPIWSSHQRLISWNLDCKGAIWAACHAGSALENMVNPGNRSQQANFLTVKDPNFTGGSGAYALSNSLILWGSHNDGTPPYTHRLPADPIMQFMGIIDGATTNGSEQIFMPRQGIATNPSTFSLSAVARWNPGAKILVYDPSQSNVTNPNLTDFRNVASVMVYGRGYDNPNRGWVMYEAGHSHNKDTGPANVAAMRAFFNFSFLASNEKVVLPTMASIPPIIAGGAPVVLSYDLPSGANPANFVAQWTSTCGGTFSPNNSNMSNPTTFTAPTVLSSTNCVISVSITDPCGRTGFDSKSTVISSCQLAVTHTVTRPLCFGNANGQINMTITGAAGPYSWNWSRVSPSGTGSGTGTTITGLSAGTYNVTVTASGCNSVTFTALVTQPQVLATAIGSSNIPCFGGTGAVFLNVTGGTQPYTYNWADLPGANNPMNRSGLPAGNYFVTVTDANGCTASANTTITGPASAVSATATVVDVSCFGASNGSITINAMGGTGPYTYEWADGPTTPMRTGLAAGVYTLVVYDSFGCSTVLTVTITQPSALLLSVVKTDPTCPPGANPPVNMDGAIDLTVMGGTGPYTYNWADLIPPPVEPQDRTGLAAGIYSVTVTDNKGCTASTSVTLTNLNGLPSAPTIINNN